MLSDLLLFLLWFLTIRVSRVTIEQVLVHVLHIVRLHGREQQNLFDVVRVGEEHRQTIDADAHTAGRRQAVL